MRSLIKKGKPLGGKVRFNPGHYYALIRSAGGDSDVVGQTAIFDTKANGGELANCPMLRGVQIRFSWAQLEPTEGNYVWTDVYKYLDLLKLADADGGTKKLIIFLNVKTFNSTHDVVPAYMHDDEETGTYNGGQYAYVGGSDGFLVRWDNAAVQARFAALAAALGREFAFNDQIEMISLNETATGTPIGVHYGGVLLSAGTPTELQAFTEAWLSGWLAGDIALKAAMPYTIIRQMINHPRKELSTSGFVQGMKDNGIAFGAPDSFMEEQGYQVNVPYDGLYHILVDNIGAVVIGMEVQATNYGWTNTEGISKPANGWVATTTVSDNGSGKVRLTSATTDHGYHISDYTNTLLADHKAGDGARLSIASNINGFLAGDYTMLAIVNARVIDIDYVYSAGLIGAPTTMLEAPNPAHPYQGDSGAHAPFRSYVPDFSPAITYQGFAPSIKQYIDFLVSEFNAHYIIWTRSTTASTRVDASGETNHFRVRKHLNTVESQYGISGRLITTRPTAISTVADYKTHTDVAYGADPENIMDVYSSGRPDAPCIVMVHGGFWVLGDKANASVVDHKVLYWCGRGYTVISINYRLNGLPLQQVLDIEKAIDYIKANAATYDIDTAKIVLMGHSSGGHIATLFAITRPTEIAGAVILDSAVMDMDDTMNNPHAAAFDTIFGVDQAYWNANSPKYQWANYNDPTINLTHTLIVSSTISAQMTAQNTAFATQVSGTLLASDLAHDSTNSDLGLYGDYTQAVYDFIDALV